MFWPKLEACILDKSHLLKPYLLLAGLQAAATEANANNLVGLLTSPAQNNSIMSRIKLVVHCIGLFTYIKCCHRYLTRICHDIYYGYIG